MLSIDLRRCEDRYFFLQNNFRQIVIIFFLPSSSVLEFFEICFFMSPSFTEMYAGSREIGQPGSYLAQASFRKFVCVRGSVSSVLWCVQGRNGYKNNVSMGMTRRSFYLLNLRRISRDGRGKNGKGGERSEEAERKQR